MRESSYLSDTQPEAEALLLSLLRQAPAWRKLEMLGQLNQMARTLALSGLRQRTLEQQVRVHLEQALRVADFVKFAKYQPNIDDNKRNLTIIRNAIESLNKQQARGVPVVTGN